MKIIENIKIKSEKKIEHLKEKSKMYTRAMEMLTENYTKNMDSIEYAFLFEERSQVIEDSKHEFMSLRFAGIN